MAQYDSYDGAVDEPEERQGEVAESDGNTFTTSFARGTDNLQASLYATSSIIGELTGFDAISEWGEEGMYRNINEAAENPPEIHSWDDVDTLSEFGTYWLQALGEQAPQFIGDAAAGVAGTLVAGPVGGLGAIGTRVAGRAGLTVAKKAAFGKALKRKMGDKAYQKFGVALGVVNPAKLASAGGGIFLSNVAQNAGETQQRFKREGIDEPGTALTAGVIKGALDTLAPLQLLAIARKGGVPASTVPELIGGIMAKAGITTAVEGATEAAQTVIDHIAQRIHDPDFELFSESAWGEIKEAAIKGGLVGGTIGTTVATVRDTYDMEYDPDGLGRVLNEAAEERTPMLYTAKDISETVYDGWDVSKAFHLEQVGERQRVIDGVEVDFEAAAVTLANVEEDVQDDSDLVQAPTPDQLLLDIDGLMPNLEKLPLNFDENDDNVRDTLDGIDMTYGPETADKAYEWLDARKRVALDVQSQQITVDPDLVAPDTNALIGKARRGDVEAQGVLTSYGLSWDGDKPKYRMVSTAEADKVLAGERVESDREGEYTDITDNADYDKVGESDRRITFKKTERFDSDREGDQALRQKNEAEGEYQLFGGYELDEVQTVEQRSEDGTWAPLYEATAPTTAVTSRDGASVATGTADREVAVQYKGRGRATGTRRAEPSTPSKIEGTISLPNKRAQDGPSTESRGTVAAGVSRTGDRVKLARAPRQERETGDIAPKAPRPKTNLQLTEQAINERFPPEVAKRLVSIARGQVKESTGGMADTTRGGIAERKAVEKAETELRKAEADLATVQDPKSSQAQLMELRQQLRVASETPSNILDADELRAKYNNQPLPDVAKGLEREVAKKRAALAKAKKQAAKQKDATKQEQAYLARMMEKSDTLPLPRPRDSQQVSTSTGADRVAQLRVEDNERLNKLGYIDETGNYNLEFGQKDSSPEDADYEGDGATADNTLTEGKDIAPARRAPINETRYAGKRGSKPRKGEDGKVILNAEGKPKSYVLGDLEYKKYEDAANAAANLSGREEGRYQVVRKKNNKSVYQVHEVVGYKTKEEAFDRKEALQDNEGNPIDPSVSEIKVQTDVTNYNLYAGRITAQDKTGKQGKFGTEVGDDVRLKIKVFDKEGKETYSTEIEAGLVKKGLQANLEEMTPEGGLYRVTSERHFLEEVMLRDELASSPLKKISAEIAPGRGGSNSAVTNEEAVNLFIDGQQGPQVGSGKVALRKIVQAKVNARYQANKSDQNYQLKRDMDDSFIEFTSPTGKPVSFIGTDIAELGQSVMTNEKTTGEFKATEQFRYNAYTTGAALLHERGYIDKRFADARVVKAKEEVKRLELETRGVTSPQKMADAKQKLQEAEKAALPFKDVKESNPVIAGNRNHSTGKGYVLRLHTVEGIDADQRSLGMDYTQDALLSGEYDGASYDAIGDQIGFEQTEKKIARARRNVAVAKRKLAEALGFNREEGGQAKADRVQQVLDVQRQLSEVNRERVVMEDGQIAKFFEAKDVKHLSEDSKERFEELTAERDKLQTRMDMLMPPVPDNLSREQTAEHWKKARAEVKGPARAVLREDRTRARLEEQIRRYEGERKGKENVEGFEQQELKEGQGIDTLNDDSTDVGFLRERDKDYGPDGVTRITERNREISETRTEGAIPAPSVTADTRGETAPTPRSRRVEEPVRKPRGAARPKNTATVMEASSEPQQRAVVRGKEGTPADEAADVVQFKQVGPRREGAILPKDQGLVDANGAPLTRTIGYGNIGKGTVNFVDGILESVGLKHIKMVVAHLESVDDVYTNGHITAQEKLEVEQKFEADPDRKAVFVPRGDTGVIITRNHTDKDLMLSVVGHEVGHGVFNGIRHKIFNPVTDREKALSTRLQKAFHKDVDDPSLPSYTRKTEAEFVEWFADKISASARGILRSKTEQNRGLAERFFQSSTEQLRTVFNKTKGQTNPRFHKNTVFANVIKEYVNDNVFENIRSIGYGKIESIILKPVTTNQTAGITHAQLGMGARFWGALQNGSVNVINKSQLKRAFDVHNRMQLHGMGVISDMIYKETNSRKGSRAYYNQLNNARADFMGRLKQIFPNRETAANMNQIMEQLAQELPTAELTPQAKKVRKLLGEFHRYMNDAGFPVEFDPLFFPRDYQLGTIEARPQQFMDLLTAESTPGAKDGLSKRQARTVLEGFLTPIDHLEPDGMLAKKLKTQYERQIPASKMKQLNEAGFVTPDPQAALKQYFNIHTEYAEHYRAFGGFEYVQGYHAMTTIEAYATDDEKAAAYAKNRRLLEAKMKLHDLWSKPTNSAFTKEQVDQYYFDSLNEAQRRGYLEDDGDGGFRWLHPDARLRQTMQNLTDAKERETGSKKKAQKWNEEANTLLEHALGRNSRPDRNSFIFNAIGEVRAYESLRTLMMSGVASVPEVAVAYQRTKGEVGMVNFAKILWDSAKNYQDVKEMAEMIGAVQNDMASIIAMDMLSVHDGVGGRGRFARNLIGPLLKYNGNEAIVNYSRAVSMKAGMHFLRSSAKHATGPDGKRKTRALRYLQELNIDAATVLRWMNDTEYKGTQEATTQRGTSYHANDAAAVRNAINTFVNEAVMRPNLAERPTWADHPIGTFVYHLKTFAYSFGKRVVGGGAREMNARRKEGTSSLQALGSTMGYAIPSIFVFSLFGALSDELRNRVATLVGEGPWRGTWGANREDPTAMVAKWMSRAGFDSAPFFDPIYDLVTGNPNWNSTAFGAGPTASHIFDLLKPEIGMGYKGTVDVAGVDVDKRVLKSIPIVNQLPYLKGVKAMPPVKNKGVAGAVYDFAKALFAHSGPRKEMSRFSGVVTEIEDGDTAFVRMANGDIRHVRLFGIDTNEKRQKGGDEQTRALSDMVLGKRVAVGDYGEGVFGRTLGVIYLNGEDINRRMLSEGKAWYSHKYASDQPDELKNQYVTALNSAFSGKKAQWDGRDRVNPAAFKRMKNQIERERKRLEEEAEGNWWEF